MRIILRELFETVILALAIFLALQFSIRNYRVEGPSMLPTMEESDHVIVNKLVYMRIHPNVIFKMLPFLDVDKWNGTLFPFHPPRRGEIVIFRFPKDPTRDFVKRVIGEPGDVVEIRSGTVYINGKPLDESEYLTSRSSGAMEKTTVPPESYFVLGDNRGASHDSRAWGTVPAENLIGRAWVGFWPLDRVGPLQSFIAPWSNSR